MKKGKKHDDNTQLLINRDISWLSFNERVLQEAEEKTVPLSERIKFLGIYSNNFDEFFRVRVATITRLRNFSTSKEKAEKYEYLLLAIQKEVIMQQKRFAKVWKGLLKEFKNINILFKTNYNLNREQKKFVTQFFEDEVSSYIIPLVFSPKREMPYLRDKSIFLAVKMIKKEDETEPLYSIVEIPSKSLGRFVKLPSPEGEEHIILLEDIIRYNLPKIFSFFNVSSISSYIFKITKDAEMDIEEHGEESQASLILKGIKNRRKGKPVRFVYHSMMDTDIKKLLIKKINKFGKCNVIPGGRIHNFKHFMGFPKIVNFKDTSKRSPSFIPKIFTENNEKISTLVKQQDLLLHFPYHSFTPIIDMLRQAAMDETVDSIQITLYRLADNSKIINALINAARNGIDVFVVLELKARFSEEANLEWKDTLEEEGVKVSVGIKAMKIHSKVCLIQGKEKDGKPYKYGYISTGNLNEQTSKFYCDHCLMTADKKIMADIETIFFIIKNWTSKSSLQNFNTLKHIIVSPTNTRKEFLKLIKHEIDNCKKGLQAKIIIKLNGLSDPDLVKSITKAVDVGVDVNLIIRGIYRLQKESWMDEKKFVAISIVDEYLEHSRVMYFYHNGKEKMYISSADWMHRNLDMRVEVTTPIKDEQLKEQLKTYLQYQLSDNVKARILDKELSNLYQQNKERPFRSQIKIYQYLKDIK